VTGSDQAERIRVRPEWSLEREGEKRSRAPRHTNGWGRGAVREAKQQG